MASEQLIDFAIVRNSRALYIYELNELHSRLLPDEESQALALRACHGDADAKEQLITCCLRYVAKVAAYYAHFLPIPHDEYLDLVSVGNLALVECFERAIHSPNPMGYLLAVAKKCIYRHCAYRAELITIPEKEHHRGKVEPVLSLDMALSGTGWTYQHILAALEDIEQETDAADYEAAFGALDQALDTLTERQRDIIMRLYGLRGYPAERMREQAKRLGQRDKSLYALRDRAMSRLRVALEQKR
jgi:RNA polymerase sporulation-specific sigma factor